MIKHGQTVSVDSNRSIVEFPIHKEIFITGTIDDESAAVASNAIRTADCVGGIEPIKVHLSIYNSDMEPSKMVHCILKNANSKTIVYCDGIIDNSGLLIALGAKTCIAYKHAIFVTSAKQITSIYLEEYAKIAQNQFIEILASKCNKSIEEVKKFIFNEAKLVYHTALEMHKFGLIDDIY